MEAVIRALKAELGPLGSPCAFLLDDIDAVGGSLCIHKVSLHLSLPPPPSVVSTMANIFCAGFVQVLKLLLDGVVSGALSAHTVTLAALGEPPSTYNALLHATPSNRLTLLDCFTDPYGWSARQETTPGTPTLQVFPPTGGLHQLKDSLLTTAVGMPNQRTCAVIDSLSPLIDAFGAQKVVALLASLRQHPSVACVVCLMHADLHSPADVAAVTHGACCLAYLQPASGLSATLVSGSRPHRAADPLGRVVVKSRSRKGCVKVDVHDYWIDEEGLRYAKSTAAPAASRHAASQLRNGSNPAADVATPTAAAAAALPSQLAGGMHLGLSEREEAARKAVRLPYEHQGQSALYSSGDWRDYLPEEAGGRRQGSSRLGHIMYVRDSDSEEPDSDEDPDDDLDI